MSAEEETRADLESAHMTTGPHFMRHMRERLKKQGIFSAQDLAGLPDGRRARTAGIVIVRQRPGTAKGFLFITLEDETGLSQAIVRPDLYKAYRTLIQSSAGLIVEGTLQKQEGGMSLRASRLWKLDAPPGIESHDFR
jgi:error-prone DNA polymerase